MPNRSESSNADAPALVIPAAGLGTRMKSVDRDLPKEMLDIAGKPAIQYAVEEGIAAGVARAVIVISPAKDMIRAYFEDPAVGRAMYPKGAKGVEEIRRRLHIDFVVQSEPLGEAHAIGLARASAGPDPITVIYPDNLWLPPRRALLELCKTYRTWGLDVVGLAPAFGRGAPQTIPSGRVDLDPAEPAQGLFRVVRTHPKAEGPFPPRFDEELRTCGIFVFGPHLFDYIERAAQGAGAGEFTDAAVLDAIIAERGLMGLRLRATLFDIGSPIGYEACRRFVSGHVAQR